MPARRTILEEVTTREAAEHPLFPVEEGEEIPRVDFVQVGRWEKGRLFYGPVFPAHELQSTDDIFSRFGGGDYELWGRKHAKHDITQAGNRSRKVRMLIPGKPRPFTDDPAPGDAGAPVVDAPAYVQAPAMSTGMEQLMLMMFQTQQAAAAQQAAQTQAAQAQAAESSRQFLQMMVSLMGNSKTEAASTTQMMLTLSQQNQQAMVQMMGTMLASTGRAGGGPEEFAKYAELFKTLGFAKSGDVDGGEKKEAANESIGSMLENVADAISGLVHLKGGPAAPGAAPDPNVPVTGSAADYVRRVSS